MASRGRNTGYGYNELLADIHRGNYAPIYLFLGKEGFLARQGTTALKQALLDEENYSWNLAEYGPNEMEAGEVVAFLNTLPVFGTRRVAIIEDFHQWKAADIEGLLPVLEDMPDYAHLILISASIDKRTKCYRTVSAQGQVVDIAPLDAPAAAGWVIERGQASGLKFSRKAAQQLVSLVGPSLWQLDKEIEKLATYKDEHDVVVREADIDLMAIPSKEVADNAIFRFTDALVAGARAESMELLQELLASGREPLSILAMIARQWRIIAFAWEASENGIGIGEISKELGVPHFAVQRALGQGQRVGPKGIRRALAASLRTDREIKSGYHLAPRALEILVVRLTEDLAGVHH
ncbi:MAG: DNA polymerase III subunit delta [Firmicutes bacterium]|nr:DNA polymerase III subunit delta [Bacillota bacterium]